MGIKFHRYSDVKPTAADADANGKVLWRTGNGEFYCTAPWNFLYTTGWTEWAALNEEPQFPHQAARKPQPFANIIATLREDFKSYYQYIPSSISYFDFFVRVIRAVIDDERNAKFRAQEALHTALPLNPDYDNRV